MRTATWKYLFTARRVFLLLRVLSLTLLGMGWGVPVEAQTTATTTPVAYGQSAVGILQAGDGNFYAPSPSGFYTCDSDPTQECAYIYKMTPTGVTSIFYRFQPVPGSAGEVAVSMDGLWPVALFVGADGSLYGACKYNGPKGGGSIFQLTLDGTLTVLKSFKVGDPGYTPSALIQGADGDFYFTNGVGIYRLANDGTGTVSPVYVYPFDSVKQISPMGNGANSIVQGSDGNLYITQTLQPQTSLSDPHTGAIAQLTLSGQFTSLHSFAADGSEGDKPGGPLVQGSDGSFYGITQISGNLAVAKSPGVIFTVTTSHGFTVLYKFTGGADGNRPNTALILGSDGNLYGTTLLGGDAASPNCAPVGGCGTLFQLVPTPPATLTTLHTFEGGVPDPSNPPPVPTVDGATPTAPLVQTEGGFFYGTTGGNPNSIPIVYETSLTPAIPSPIQLTLDPEEVVTDNPTTLTWQVLNAYSLTAQQCVASIVGNPAGAGTWSGLQKGTMVNGVYTGSATITPTANGIFTYALTCGGYETGLVTVESKDDSKLQIAPPNTSNATVHQPFDLVLQAIGGTTAYFWNVNGALPDGLTFVGGTLSGTPLQYGKYPLVFVVDDSSPSPLNTTRSYTLTVVSGLTLRPSLPNPVLGTPYKEALYASGGIEPYTFQLTLGILPNGLQLNTSTGVISGTPTVAGPFSFTLTVFDSETTKDMYQTTFNLTVGGPLMVTSLDLPNASVGMPYSFPLVAMGGTPPYTWSFGPNGPFQPNVVPPGLNLSTGGKLSGTPTQYTFPPWQFNSINVVVSDFSTPTKMTAPATLTISVESTLQITVTSLPNGTVGIVTNVPLTATGGIPPYKWSVSATPNPNIGVSVVNGDTLQYNPTAALTSIVTINVQDSEITPASAVPANLELVTVPPQLLLTTTTLTSSNTAAGTGESVTFTAKVTPSAGITPTGQVIFYSGTTTLGTVALDANANATLQTSFATTGVYGITATYSGNGLDAPSTSTPLTETVITPTVSASVSPSSLTIQSGQSGQLVITITPDGGYTGTVKFSCGILPPHVSCAFAPPSLTIAAGSGPAMDTLTVSTEAPLMAMMRKPVDGVTSRGLLAAAALWFPGSLAVLLGLVRRKRRPANRNGRNLWIVALLCFAAASIFTGCSASMNNARPGTYTIPITLTLSGGATQNVNASVIVK
jgi:hypothetical protein